MKRRICYKKVKLAVLAGKTNNIPMKLARKACEYGHKKEKKSRLLNDPNLIYKDDGSRIVVAGPFRNYHRKSWSVLITPENCFFPYRFYYTKKQK